MIDDMQGLYSHVSDALRDGKRIGRQDYFDKAIDACRQISVEQESQQGPEADRGFHVAQACCKALVELKAAMDATKPAVV